MNLNLTKIQIQKQVFSVSMEHSLNVLLLPHEELVANIEQELQDNPLLEAEINHETESSFDWNQIHALASLPSIKGATNAAEEDSEQEPFSMACMMTLEDHLLQQLYWEIAEPSHRKIGEFIIGNLDQDGYLLLSCEEIGQTLSVSPDIVQRILKTIQNFDPIGIATQNIKECLIVQLSNRPSSYSSLAIQLINECWEDLGHKRYAAISKKFSVSMEDIMETVYLIGSLEPKPARNYRSPEPTAYVQPDIYVRKDDEEQFIIETNKRDVPLLKINQTYRKLLNRPNITEEERTFIQEKLNNALNFIKNIQQRGSTLIAISKFIVSHQKKFFDGDQAGLAPLSLKEVAASLGRAESTISRAINNKYMETSLGLFPLKFFFSHSVTTQNNENISAHNIKEEIAQLIMEEDKHKPLSDHDIQKHFEEKGIPLARRTVAKYRQMLDIPSSHQRNK